MGAGRRSRRYAHWTQLHGAMRRYRNQAPELARREVSQPTKRGSLVPGCSLSPTGSLGPEKAVDNFHTLDI